MFWDKKKVWQEIVKQYNLEWNLTEPLTAMHTKGLERLQRDVNSRLQALESAKFTESQAYQQFVELGHRSKLTQADGSELLRELDRNIKFMTSKTSTVEGYTETVKQSAISAGLRFTNVVDTSLELKIFFETVDEVYDNAERMGKTVFYKDVWTQIQLVIENYGLNLVSDRQEILERVKKVVL